MATETLTIEEIQKRVRFLEPCFYVVYGFDFTKAEWGQVKEIAKEQNWDSASGVGFFMPIDWNPPEKQE